MLLQEKEASLDKATSVTGGSDGEKVQTSRKNTSEDKYINYSAYSELIDKRVDELYAIKCEILAAINKIDDSIMRKMLIMRYIKFYSWNKVAARLKYSKRQLYRLHEKALKKIKDVT
jgi:DNA-directed RNA polymerase specialized sigma subunit